MKRTFLKQEKAQSMVELAIALVVLLILLSGVVDLGRAFFAFMALRDAAQEGAAYASLFPADPIGIENRIRFNSSSPVDLQSTDIIVDPPTYSGPLCHGSGVEIVVRWPDFPLIMPYWQIFFGRTTVPLTARIEDTILRPPCK